MEQDGGKAGQFWGNLWNVPTADIPEPGELVEELRQIVRSGLRPSRLKNLPKLFGLAVVATEAQGSRPLDLAIALEGVVSEAVEELGDGPTGRAVALLLGLQSRSRGLLLKDRRDLAADSIGIETETFRKGWEAGLLEELASEIYKLESERRVPIRVVGSKRRGPILDDLRSGTSGKSLDRREAEARLWALMYELRAELLAVARIQDEQPGEAAWLPHSHSALFLFARFVDAMARFVEEYASAFVMAGNEVTVQEATSLLRIRPPLEADEMAFLRIKVAKPHSVLSTEALLRSLQQEDRGSALVRRWIAWLSTTGDTEP